MTHKSTACPLDCPDACGVLVETDTHGNYERLRGNPEHSYSKGSLCGKTSLYGEVQSSSERLLRPLVRTGGKLQPASWEEALRVIRERVQGLDGREILALEYAGNMGKIARKFPARIMNALNARRHDCGVCDNTSTVGYQVVLGDVIGGDLEEIETSDAVVLWGTDIARTVQHLQPAIQRLCKRGVPVVAIDIYRTDTIEKLEKWGGHGLVIRPGTDAALALGITRYAFENERADREFLNRECAGAERFEEHVRSSHHPEWVAETCGLALEDFNSLAQLLTNAERPFVKTGVGWTRRRNGVHGMRAVCSLAAVLGKVDRLHYESSDHFALNTDVIERPDLSSNDEEPLIQVRAGEFLSRGDFRAVFVWGHNPVVTLPDSERVRAGLAREDTFVVVHDHFLTETAAVADVVLPAATFLEQADVYSSYGHRVLQFGRGVIATPGEVKSNVAAFAAIAEALELPAELWKVDEEDLCRELLEQFRDRLEPAQFEALLAGEPTKLPPRKRKSYGTASGKIELANDRLDPPMASFVPDERAGHGEAERGAFALLAAPSRATHNSTYLHSSRHRAKAGPPTCLLHSQDARSLDVEDGGALTLSNSRGSVTLSVQVEDRTPRGVIRVDGVFRACDVAEGVGINALVTPATSDLANGNSLYSTRVDARKAHS